MSDEDNITKLPPLTSSRSPTVRKKRILFVDDDPLVIEGLRRMLRSMRKEWDMYFEQNAVEALKLMETKSFEVVVSDMRMPGMNGAEFLNVVMKRFPRTIRFILSGYADDSLILKCIGSTHQFLSKPCDPELLKHSVNRATALDIHLKDPKLRKLISQIDHLPSMPSLYLSMVEVLQDPEAPIKRVSQIISQDIGMSSRILNLVNSAFFGLSREISDIHEAVAYIGLDIIKSLVLSMNLFSRFEDTGCKSFNVELVWHHSLRAANAARAIALYEHAPAHVINESFVAGLLHNCGKLILAKSFPEKYEKVIAAGPGKILWAEKLTFKATYGDVGAYLLGLWGLPVPIVEAVALHRYPDASINDTFTPLTAVHAGLALSREQMHDFDPNKPHLIDFEYLDRLGLRNKIDSWRQVVKEGNHFEMPHE